MIVNKRVRMWHVLAASPMRLVVLIVYPLVMYFLWLHRDLDPPLPLALPALMGTILSILLGFRTNSAYDRWWEARQIWGAIVNESRTWARQVLTFVGGPEGAPSSGATLHDRQQDLVYRQVAWTYALGRSLRGQDPQTSISQFLDPAERAALASSQNIPNTLLETQGEILRGLRAKGDVDGFGLMALDGTLTRLCDAMGKCERINNTVFPTLYAYLVHLVAWIFFLVLPISLADSLGWLMLPAAFMVGGVFIAIEAVASDLQDPFEDKDTDTPMTALARTIEINLRQQLGETDLPPPAQAKHGVLM